MEEECCDEESRGDQANLPSEILFAIYYKTLENLKLEELSEYSKKGVVYTKQNPAFVVAWLKDHIAALFKEKETFMKGFVGDIEPTNFRLNFNEEKREINVKLSFLIDEEEEVDLELNGNLHRSDKGEVGVEWSKV